MKNDFSSCGSGSKGPRVKYSLKRSRIILVGFVVLLSSCATLPKPQTENSTLLVIPVKTIKKTNYEYYRHYIIKLSNTDATIKIEPHSGYLFVRHLQPGEYAAVKLISLHRKHTRKREFPLYIPFTLSAGSITIFPSRLEILLRKEQGRDYTYYQYWEFYDLPEAEKLAIIQEIEGYRRIEYWQIQPD